MGPRASRIAKRIFFAVISLLALGLLAFAIRIGIFASVEVTHAERGPHRLVYLDHQGPYSEMVRVITRAMEVFYEAQGPEARSLMGPPAAVYLSDPSTVPAAELRSQGGFLVEGKVEIQPPLQQRIIPRREVALGRFEGEPRLGGAKAYPAIGAWLDRHPYRPDGDALEIYHAEGFVEYEVPIAPVRRSDGGS